MNDLKISRILRIDYKNLEYFVEDEPLGLFFQIGKNKNFGINFTIDNSGDGIEIKVQSLNEFSSNTLEHFETINEINNNSKLNLLIGKTINQIYFAIFNLSLMLRRQRF